MILLSTACKYKIFSKRLQILCTLILYFAIAHETHAATDKNLSVPEAINLADAVIVGRVQSISVGNTGVRIDSATKLNQFDLFQKIDLYDSYRVNHRGLQPLENNVAIYVDGGTIKLPEKLKTDLFLGTQTLTQGNSAVAIPRLEVGERVMVFLMQNGSAEAPFPGLEYAFLKISSSGEVIGTNSIPINSIVDGRFVYQSVKVSFSKPDFAEGPIPGPEQDPNDLVVEKIQGPNISVESFIEYISNVLSSKQDSADFERNASKLSDPKLNPNLFSTYTLEQAR